MGLLDFLKKPAAKAPPAEPPTGPAPGELAIESAFAAVYPQTKPKYWNHNGVMRMHDLRNPPENPLDAVAMYDAGKYWHYVSYGLSDLYENHPEDDWSGFGFELTFRAAKKDGETEAPFWPINVLVSLARAVFAGEQFAVGHTVKTGPIDGKNSKTNVTACLLTKDPGVEAVHQTPHGKLVFLHVLGVEDAVRQKALAEGFGPVLAEIREANPQLVTRV